MSSVNPSAQPMFVREYVIPPVAAGLGIVPAFYGLMTKSALQSGESRPLFNPVQVLKAGITDGAPAAVMTIGAQLIFQSLLEKQVFPDKKGLNITEKMVSTVTTAFVTSPFLAVLNAKTMSNNKTTNKTVLGSIDSTWQLFKLVKLKQAMVITARETGFLGGLSASEPLGDFLKKKVGEGEKNDILNTMVDYGAAYASGVMGSMAGHVFDTALTRLQKNKPIHINWKALSRGIVWRAFAGVGVFSVAYKASKDMLNTLYENKP